MADYAFRSYEERQKIQEMVEAGLSAKDIAASLGISPSAVYAELRRGRDGTRLPDKRLATTPNLPSSVSSRALSGEAAELPGHDIPHLLKPRRTKP